MEIETFLRDEDYALLEENGETVSYSAQETILRQDTTTDRIFLIRTGMVQVDFSRVYGTDTLAYLGEGEFFGEVSFLDHGPTSASVSAARPCELLEISRDTMEQLLESHPKMAARFYHTIALTLARRIRARNK